MPCLPKKKARLREIDSVWNVSNHHAADGRLSGNVGANTRGSEAGAPGKKKAMIPRKLEIMAFMNQINCMLK